MFFLKQIKGLLFLIACLSAIEAVSISYTYWFVGQITQIERLALPFILTGIAIVAISPIASNLLNYLKNTLYIPHFGNMIRRQCFYHTSRQSISYFQNDFSGRIANKILQCSSALRDAALSVIGSLVSVCTLIISNAILLSHVNFLLALPLIVWTASFIIILGYFLPKIKHRTSLAAECMSTLTGQIVDSISNILLAKYFARTKDEDLRTLGFLEAYGHGMSYALQKTTQQSIALGCINFLLVTSVILIGYTISRDDSLQGVSALVMALPMVLQTTFLSSRIMNEMSSLFENVGTIQNSIELLSKPHTIIDNPHAKDLIISKDQSGIIFKNVSFRYEKTNYFVLNKFSLEIQPGEKVGITGRSGEGKSTIISLLMRAFDIDTGEILVGGRNIKDVTQDSLRRNISVVTQDNYLFHRSVLENIRYGRTDATTEDIIHAAKLACAHEFIEAFVDDHGNKGYEALIGEHGVKLSGGQRQRIDIARAILKNSPILILDEATASMDSESEDTIQTALESVMDGKTVIAVAHRLSTLKKMDRIIVIENGAIIESGTHDTLIRNSDSHYAHLWTLQTGGTRQRHE
ncbi:MAG: ABC transporter ATP-binding protein [Pseudobdellovibrionaceae bacterium]|nr:ABC transporter ATP-binding protein [Pseudobdellovibrionaceae bacterium]